MAKKTKRGNRTADDIDDDEDDSEDKFEEIEEPAAEPMKPMFGATLEDDAKPDEGWRTLSDSPPEGAQVEIETGGECVPGYKRDGVWYTAPPPNEDGTKNDPVPVQITRWR